MRRPWQYVRPSVDVFGSFRSAYAVIGPPNSGKTAFLARAALTAPGALLTFSTNYELARDTAAARIREDRGLGPVWWVNPGRAGGFPSNCGYSPLAGCESPGMAMEAAGALMAAAPHDKKDAHWDALSKRFLQYLMHAAALHPDRPDIRIVRQWAADPANPDEPMEVLDRWGTQDWAQQLDDLAAQCRTDMDGKTATAVAGGVLAALAWLDDPGLAVLACPPPGYEFDARAFLRERGTVYAIGADSEHNPQTPFLSCFCTYVWNEANRAAQDPREACAARGKLDPPLMIVGDEPGNSCLVPYDKWASTAGGRGVCLITGWQSDAQMPMRWGDHAARVMLDAFGGLVVFGGVKGDLAALASSWAADKPTWHKGERGAKVLASAPTFSPAVLGTLKDYRAMVKYGRRRAFLADMPDVRRHPWYREVTAADFPSDPVWEPAALAARTNRRRVAAARGGLTAVTDHGRTAVTDQGAPSWPPQLSSRRALPGGHRPGGRAG
jgi:hypothetical protein